MGAGWNGNKQCTRPTCVTIIAAQVKHPRLACRRRRIPRGGRLGRRSASALYVGANFVCLPRLV